MADNKVFQKKANISLVMQTIRVFKHISRIDISRELGLDRSTITNIVTKLIADDLLLEVSEGASDSRGGRKPVLLGLNSKFGIVLGLEIQVNFYRATLLNLDGSIIWHKEGSIGHVKQLSHAIEEIFQFLKPEIDSQSIPLLGIGVGVPGHIDNIEGKILSSSPFFSGASDDNVNLSELCGVPLVLDNDANCCAWGVLEQRKNEGVKNFIYSIVELHGKDSKEFELGFGIVINGQVYYGSNFAAGELWDSLITKFKLCSFDDYRDFFVKLFDTMSLFVSFLNPSHLFLGGEFIKHRELAENVLANSPLKDVRCEIVFSSHKEFEVSFGAASMFVERLFAIPGVGNIEEPKITWDRVFNSRKSFGDKK